MTPFKVFHSMVTSSLCAVFVMAIGGGCPGQEIAATRCNDARDCPANEVCSDGVCEEAARGPEAPEPSARPDAGVGAEDGGAILVDSGLAEEEDAGSDDTLDGGSLDAGGDNDGGGVDSGVDADAGVEPPDAVIVGNLGATLSVDHADVNPGQQIRVTVDILAGNSCDLSYNNTALSLVGGRFQQTFLPSGDDVIVLDCLGFDEALEINYRVFNINLSLLTTNPLEDVGPHLLKWNTAHSSSCTLFVVGGEVLLANADGDGEKRTTLSNGVVEVECDGAEGVLISASVNVDTSPLVIGDVEIGSSGELATVTFTTTRPAACSIGLPTGGDLELGFDDDFYVDAPVDVAGGQWTITCDSLDGALDSVDIFIDDLASIDFFQIEFVSGGLMLRWSAEGECSINGEAVPSTGELIPDGDGATVYRLLCETNISQDAQVERVFFGNLVATESDDYDAVVGDVVVAQGTTRLPNLEYIIGSLTIGNMSDGTPAGSLTFNELEVVTSSLTVTTDVESLSFFALYAVGGDFNITDSDALVDLDLFDLVNLGGNLNITFCAQLEDISVAGLTHVGGDVVLTDLPATFGINLRQLRFVNAVTVETAPALETLRLDDVENVEFLRIAQVDGLGDLRLDALTAAASFFISFAHGISVLELPVLSDVDSFTLLHNHLLVGLDAPNLDDILDVTVKDNHIMTTVAAESIGDLGLNAVTCPNLDDCSTTP